MVVRDDLPTGVKFAQSLHALADFSVEHRKAFLTWKKQNHIVSLTCENEEHLEYLLEKAEYLNINHSHFREPDIGFEITAAVFDANPKTEKLLSQLPLLK